MYIIIVGAGQVGYYLTKTLISEGHEVTLVDWKYDRVAYLESELGENVMYATGSSIDGLEKAGAERADVVVAVTGDDEDNLVVCQLAKMYFKVPKAIGRINNPKNQRIFNELGISTTVSGTTEISETIKRYVAKQTLTTLLTFNHDEMVLVEAEIDDASPIVNKKLKDIKLPYAAVIAIILRGGDVLFPKGSTEFKKGDLIIAISTVCEKENVKKILLGSGEAS